MKGKKLLISATATAALGLLESWALAEQPGQRLSPYVGQERREIKALSSEEIDDLLNGRGMGLARAAELNHLPGPRHVLELTENLDLSAEQVARTHRVHDRMLAEAARLGPLIIERERALDELFVGMSMHPAGSDSGHAAGSAHQDPHERVVEQMQRMVLEVGRLQGELRATHLRAHIEMREILLPQQVHRYMELRGYASGHTHGH